MVAADLLRHSGKTQSRRTESEVPMQKPFLAGALLCVLAPDAFACETWEVGDLTVRHAWSRAAIGADRPGVFYVEITNQGTEPDTLIGIATPAAGPPILDETVMTDGVASMPHAMSIPVPAGETVALSPGGFHGMLTGLTAAWVH
jgi:periplasmic copper chaperone A